MSHYLMDPTSTLTLYGSHKFRLITLPIDHNTPINLTLRTRNGLCAHPYTQQCSTRRTKVPVSHLYVSHKENELLFMLCLFPVRG